MRKGINFCKHLYQEKKSVESFHIANDYLAPRDLCNLITAQNSLTSSAVFYKGRSYCLGYESCVWRMIADIAKDRGEKVMYLCALMSYMTILEEELPYCEYEEARGKNTYINGWKKKHKELEDEIETAMKFWKENINGKECNLGRD